MVPLEPEPGLLPDLVLAAGFRFWLVAVEQLSILDMDTCRHTIDQLASVLRIQVMLDIPYRRKSHGTWYIGTLVHASLKTHCF